ISQEQGGAPPGRGGGRGSSPKLPTDAQWAAMSPKAREYVDKARALAGTDPDLQFDFGIFCKATGGSQNEDRATIGVPDSEPHLQPFPAPHPPVVLGALRLFDNFYWIGNTGMVVPVKYQGREHPILLVTAGTDVNTRGDFIGGYEHIWDEAIKMKVENVMQSHPNTNMNLLARTKYVNDHYPPPKNPLLYGA